MIRAIRPAAMAQDDAGMVVGWNVAPNIAYVLRLLPGSASCGVLLYDEGGSTLIATGAALAGTGQPCVLIPQAGQTVGMADAELGWHLLITTTGTESQRTIRIGPAVDLPDEIHPVYGADDLAVVRATAAIDQAAHYIDDVTVTCLLGLGAGLGDVVSVPVDGVAVVGQVESVTWTATPDGATEQAVIRRHVAIAPEPVVAPPTPPTVADDTGETDAATATSGNVMTNDEHGLTVTAVNGLSGNVGQAVAGSDGGVFTVASNGAWTFDPNGDFAALTGSDTATTSVTYHASDGVSEAMGTLTVTVSSGAVPVPTDPYWGNVTLCINAADGIVDAKGNSLTVAGHTTISNALGFPTIYFDGSGDHINIPHYDGIGLATGDFTIDGFFQFSDVNNSQVVFSKGGNWGSAGGIVSFFYLSYKEMTTAFGDTTWILQKPSPVLSANVMYYYKFMRKGSVFTAYIDNVLSHTTTSSASGTDAASWGLVLGNDRDFNAPQAPMHIAAFRVTKGVAREDSTIPTFPFPTA